MVIVFHLYRVSASSSRIFVQRLCVMLNAIFECYDDLFQQTLVPSTRWKQK